MNAQLKAEQDKSHGVQQQLASTTTEKQDLVQLQNEIIQREASMKHLQASLSREQEKAGSLEQKLQEERAQQNQETKTLRSQYEQSQANLTVAEARLEKIKTQLAEEQNKSKKAQQALAESTSTNSVELQRLEAEVSRRQTEMDTQRKQITNLQSELTSYKEKLKSNPSANNKVALVGPSIEILDPPITLTRGIPSVELRSAMKERTVVGKVTAPSGLLTLSVNDRSQTPDEFGVFRAPIPVEDHRTPVNVVAVDKRGKVPQSISNSYQNSAWHLPLWPRLKTSNHLSHYAHTPLISATTTL